LHNTELKDRILWFDGDSTVSPTDIESRLITGQDMARVFVSEMTNEIKQFNRIVDREHQITTKETCKPLGFSWTIPPQYLILNVGEYVANKFLEHVPTLSPEEIEPRTIRIIEELNLYETLGLQDVLRTVIYIINTLESKNVVWGVGRGSSVSSYVLYLIGAHDIDSVKYSLPINDFLKTE